MFRGVFADWTLVYSYLLYTYSNISIYQPYREQTIVVIFPFRSECTDRIYHLFIIIRQYLRALSIFSHIRILPGLSSCNSHHSELHHLERHNKHYIAFRFQYYINSTRFIIPE